MPFSAWPEKPFEIVAGLLLKEQGSHHLQLSDLVFLGTVEGEATRADIHLDVADRHHRPGGTIKPEKKNAPSIPGREIHLGRQRVAKRGAKGPDIGEKRRRSSAGCSLIQEMTQREGPRQRR
jgi:hypothetical protein